MKKIFLASFIVLLSLFFSACSLIYPGIKNDTDGTHIYDSENDIQYSNNFEVKHVFLIGLDGWGGYSFNSSDFIMPTIQSILPNSAYTLKALSVYPPPVQSLPNWSSMFMGAGPDLTKYYTNNDIHPNSVYKDKYGLFPSIFSLMKDQQPDNKVAFFYEWPTLGYLCPSGGVIDRKQRFAPDTGRDYDSAIKTIANYIKSDKPNLMVIAIDEPDEIGHEYNWYSKEYNALLTKIDGNISTIIEAIKDAGIWDDSVLIFTADHGGLKDGHWDNTPQEREIPIIITGKCVKSGFKITGSAMIYDVAATIAYVLQLKVPAYWQGKALDAFIEN